MSELQRRLERLLLRLDHMGLRVEQAVLDALRAARTANAAAGQQVNAADARIDREEVEIEQECVRLLALYQPAAVDLRAICTVIKVNNDLERIADLAAGIGRRVKHIVTDGIDLEGDSPFERLTDAVLHSLGRTVRILSTSDVETARAVIDHDGLVNRAYAGFVRGVLAAKAAPEHTADRTMTLIMLAKALERMGDLCTNIAEDVIFLRTGDVVRHRDAMSAPPDDDAR